MSYRVPPPPSLRALFDRARTYVRAEDLARLVMNDPGHAAYVASYARVLAHGIDVLFEDTGNGLPRLGSFDITENLLLSHTNAGASTTHRWFAVLTACIELLGASTYHHAPFSKSLTALLVDTFALDAANAPGAPRDLLPAVLRDLRDGTRNPHERVLAIVGELLTASMTDSEIESACRELHARHEAFQEWYGAGGEKNPFYAGGPEFIWGAAVQQEDVVTWRTLVEMHFPRSPELAQATRTRLLFEE